jgi:NADH-quinone oxidoreductase subunit K
VSTGPILPVEISNYIGLSAVLFFIGVAGVVVRRNPLIMLMSIELMWNAANLALLAFGRAWLNNAGHIFAFLVITVAAAEAAIGLAIVVIVFRRAPFVDVDDVATMKG